MKRIYKKMLSLLLAFSMLVTLFPAAALAQSEAEITAFIPIAIDGGTAGAAGYADAAAVIAYLNDHYAGVTASVYGGGEVFVPVAAWADTNGYDPAVAGSYTFTATLGEIPAGYANPSSLTATAEVVVAEAPAPEAVEIQGESEPGDIADGAYTLPVSLWHASSDQPSMGNAALEQTASLVVAEGQGTLQMTFKPLTFMGMTGYLSQLDLLDNIVFNENNYPVNYDLIPATVLSTYDVVDDFNKPDSTDPNCAGKPYPKDLSVPVTLEQQYTWVHVYVPVMGSMGFGDQVARIKLDWSNLNAEEPEDVEITSFDPIEITAGSAGSATYADAAAVIAYLNDHYPYVTASTSGGGTVSVPVTGWTDTDTYDSNTAGSYTFTATLGEIPLGYTLGEGVTATAEVMVEEAEEPGTGYVPGIYSGVGTGVDWFGDPSIKVYVQTSATEIVRVFAERNNQTESYFNTALNGVAAQIVAEQGVDGVDAVSGATLSSNGIIEGATAALANARNGNAATPEETLEVPVLLWHAINPAPSMMNALLGENPAATVNRYGSEYTATIRLVPATIMSIPVDGRAVDNIRTADKTGVFTNSPITDTLDEETGTRELVLQLNALKEPLPMLAYVYLMSGDQTLRVKLIFGVEKDRLEAAVTAAEPKLADEEIYTEESFAAFSEALSNAQALLANEDATQEEVDAATTALTSKTAGLTLKPRDRTANTLNELIDYLKDTTNGDIIRLGADLPVEGEDLSALSTTFWLFSIGRNITIEGQGHSIDGLGKYSFFRSTAGTGLTIKNIILKNAYKNGHGSAVYADKKVSLINSAIIDCTTSNPSAQGAVYTVVGGNENILSMENCVLIGSTLKGTSIYVGNGTKNVATLTNNVIIDYNPEATVVNYKNIRFEGSSKVIDGGDNIIATINTLNRILEQKESSILGGLDDPSQFDPDKWAALQSVIAETKAAALAGAADLESVIAVQAPKLRAAIAALTEEESIEITSFDPITVDGETTAAPAYADAAAVIAHLNTNYAGVTAQTASGTVSVPVTGWTDTDTYDPNTAGSYTFTAVLGEIPAGYTLGEGVTATAEVVVAEGAPVVDKTALTAKLDEARAIEQGNYTQESYAALQQAITAAEAVLADEDAAQSEVDEAVLLLQSAISALEEEGDLLADGQYTVEVYAWHASLNQPSTMALMLDEDATLNVAEGEITATIRLVKTNIYGTPVNGDTVSEVWPEAADTPTAGTGITGTYNSEDESKTFTFGLNTLDMPVLYLNAGNPMNSIVSVRLNFNMDTLTPVEGPPGTIITGFEAIAAMDGGTTAAPVYADAAAVRAALPTNVTISGTSDTVPVTEWEDTDSYNPNIADSYTFTAMLGDLPQGYSNPNNITATAEVVVASVSSAPVTIHLSSSTVLPGDTVIVSGTAAANTWISLRALDAAGNVVTFKGVKTDAAGNYSFTDFKVPATTSDSLLIITGYGANVARESLALRLASPALSADTDNNVWGQAIDLTFADDPEWRAAVTGITVDGTSLDEGQYLITPGNINIAANAFGAAGDYVIAVSAAGYQEAAVTQTILAKTAPELTADNTDNLAGQDIELTFAAAAGWQGAITDIEVNGSSIAGQYTVGEGVITVEGSVFSAAGNYSIIVKAANYYDAGVEQIIIDAAPVLTADSSNNSPGQEIEITFSDNEAWRNAASDIKVNGSSISGHYTMAIGTITIEGSVFAAAGSYTVTVQAAGYEDALVIQEILTPAYIVTPREDNDTYQIGETPEGLKTMTVNGGVTGLTYFNVQVAPVRTHNGLETLVFVHLEDGMQKSLNTTRGDFDVISSAGAGFNVNGSDTVMTYVVDELTNAIDFNPTIFH